MRACLATLIVLLIGFAAAPARATGIIECRGAEDSEASVAITTGTGPVRVPVRLDIEAGGESWTTGGGAGRAVVVLQSFDDGTLFAVDLADPQVSEVVARLRLLRTDGPATDAEAGTLAIAGGGVHPLICQGP